MEWEEAIDPARNMDSQTPCLMQCAEELCILAKAGTSRWHFSEEEFPDGFLVKYLKGSSGTRVAVSEEQSPTDTKKVVGDTDNAAALRNMCLLFGCAPVKARHGRGMKWLRGQGSLPDLKQAAAKSVWKPVAISSVPLPLSEYQSQEAAEIRSAPKTSLPSLPNSVSEGSILGKDSEAKMEKMTENATLKLTGDKPKICTPNKQKVGQVNGKGQKNLVERGNCVKYELGNAPVKLENKTGKVRKAKSPVSCFIPEEASQVLKEMTHSRTEEQTVKPTCCAGRKGEKCKPLSNAGGREVPPKHAELQTEQRARGGTSGDDTGRSPGKMTISNTKEEQPQTELLEQISLCLQRSERQKEKRDLEHEGSVCGSEGQNSKRGLTTQQETASAELESSKRDTCPLDLVKQDRNECLLKELSQMKTDSLYSQKVSSLMLENGWQLCMLLDKNHRYSLKIHALEEEIVMYYQYLLAVDGTHVTPSLKCFSTDKVCSDECLKEEMVGDRQGALGTLWGKGGESLPEKSFPPTAKQEGGRLRKQPSSLESTEAISLEERKIGYFQLLSSLKDERNSLLKEVTRLVQDEEKCLEQSCKLGEEGERKLQRIRLLEGHKESLLSRLCEAKGEHRRCAVLISELDECKNMWFHAMFELEEEKFVLQNSMERMQKENCSKCLESQNMIDNLKLEHEKLVKLMVARGIDSEEQTANGAPVAERGVQGMKPENEVLCLDSEIETACPKTLTAEKATPVTELVCCPVQDMSFEGKWGSCEGLSNDGESKVDSHFKHLLNPAKMLVPLDTHNSFVTGQLLEMNEDTSVAKSINETESQGPTPSSSLCRSEEPGHVGTQEMSEKETVPGNTRTLKEQLEKANKELQMQQEKLDKAKKEAQKWYVELGFAETRYEEVSTQLNDALSELQRFKEAKVDHPRKAPRTSVENIHTGYALYLESFQNEPQELVEEKFTIQKLEQQVLTLRAQLRDHGGLHHRYKALKNEMELLQRQIKEKNEELQRRQSEVRLAAAPFKLVSPPFSPASDLDGACRRCAGANEDAGPVAAAAAAASSVSPEAEGSCWAHGPSVKGAASLLKLTSPEKIINFHQELGKNHRSDHQESRPPSFLSISSKPLGKAPCWLAGRDLHWMN